MIGTTNIKPFNVRFPKELWYFLRRHSIDVELSMNQIIVNCMQNYKKKIEKDLIKDDKNDLLIDSAMIS